MREISNKISGSISPSDPTPIIIPSLLNGIWTANQTGNVITVSSTSGYSHSMFSWYTDMRISNYGVKVYLSFPKNDYFTNGFYDNIIIIDSQTFTCNSSTLIANTTPNIPVLSTYNTNIKLFPLALNIPSNTLTTGSTLKIEGFITFSMPNNDATGVVGQLHGISIGTDLISGTNYSAVGLFHNYSNITSQSLPSYYLYNTIKFLGGSNFVCNSYGGIGNYNTVSINSFNNNYFDLNEGLVIIPSTTIQSSNNDFQMWSMLRVEYIR